MLSFSSQTFCFRPTSFTPFIALQRRNQSVASTEDCTRMAYTGSNIRADSDDAAVKGKRYVRFVQHVHSALASSIASLHDLNELTRVTGQRASVSCQTAEN